MCYLHMHLLHLEEAFSYPGACFHPYHAASFLNVIIIKVQMNPCFISIYGKKRSETHSI
jgi:hypothetical protein